jgi:hypothetical protein
MTYLVTQIVLCLLLAALIGFIIGWAVRSMSCQKKIAELEAAWADRLAAASAGGAPVQKDDLKRIEGIGWAELAAASVDRLKGLLRRGGDRYKMHDPTSWPDQAMLAAQGRGIGHPPTRYWMLDAGCSIGSRD